MIAGTKACSNKACDQVPKRALCLQVDLKAPEPDISNLLASAQQAQLAEISALMARLRQREQEVKDAAAWRQQAETTAAQHEEEQAAELQQAQQQIAELQVHVEDLRVFASSAANSAALEGRLEEAWHRVAELEAQVGPRRFSGCFCKCLSETTGWTLVA